MNEQNFLEINPEEFIKEFEKRIEDKINEQNINIIERRLKKI